MHASSDPAASVGQRAAVALLGPLSLLLAAGCSTSSGDQAALNGPAAPATTTGPPPVGAPAVKFDGAVASVAGYPAATAALDRLQLPAGCAPTVERADQHLVSIVWKCGDSLTAATVTLDGHRLALGDILQGGYASYLSSVAAAQFSAADQAAAATRDLGTWFLTPAALAVDFPAGVVSYPLASLAPYLRDPSSL